MLGMMFNGLQFSLILLELEVKHDLASLTGYMTLLLFSPLGMVCASYILNL